MSAEGEENGEDDGDVSFEQFADLLDQSEDEGGAQVKKQKEKIRRQISQRLRMLKIKYKDVLQKVCDIYGMNWPISSVDPIVHRDLEDKTKILGIEELGEYVDNQHPLWNYDKEAFDQMKDITKDPKGLSDYVQTRWGSHKKIDPRFSLVVVEGCDEGEKKDDLAANNANQNLRPETSKMHKRYLHKRAIRIIMTMDIEAISQEVLEKEKRRKILFQHKVDPLYDEGIKVDNIKTPTSETFVPLDKFTEIIKNTLPMNTGEVIDGAYEAVKMTSHFTGDRGLSEEQVETILDMEEAYDKIQQIEDENQNHRYSGER